MRVRINYTVHIDDRFRFALNHYYGESGKASRKQVKTHFQQRGDSITGDILSEWDEHECQKQD